MIVLLLPYRSINCKVVPLTVLKCNILNYSKNCYAKNMCGWTFIARHRPTASGYKKLLCRRNMKKKYLISCGSTSWVGRIQWQWKYRRHCVVDMLLFFIDSRPLIIFSLLSSRAILRSSERLKQASTCHENTSLSNWGRQKGPADYSWSAVLY